MQYIVLFNLKFINIILVNIDTARRLMTAGGRVVRARQLWIGGVQGSTPLKEFNPRMICGGQSYFYLFEASRSAQLNIQFFKHKNKSKTNNKHRKIKFT